ncbi:MAG: VOC family protein [Gammaproteobacteria bacterium]|jgi:glyoxylase I family protein
MASGKPVIRTPMVRLIGVVLALGLAGAISAAVRFEHLAINVEHPRAVADWYVKYMGLKIVSASKKMIFVRDPGSHFMFEFYRKPGAKGSYSAMNHAATHFAFAADDADALAKRMVEGGAKILKRTTNPVGDTVINMTDPWGNMLQVIHRVKPKL